MSPPLPVVAALGLGSNIGDRAATITAAVAMLTQVAGVRLIALSALRETQPVRTGQGDPGGPFMNGAALIETTLAPLELLARLHEIESRLGRDRASAPSGSPRTIDLDLLLFGTAIINEPGLVVPHPRLAERAFVLGPLAEVGPDLPVVSLSKTVAHLAADLAGAPSP